MKIDFTQELKMYRGLPIVINPETNETATLKFAALEALMMTTGQDIGAVEILRRNELARKIWNAQEAVDIAIEDVSLIKSMIPLRFKDAIVIAAPALEMLEGGRV